MYRASFLELFITTNKFTINIVTVYVTTVSLCNRKFFYVSTFFCHHQTVYSLQFTVYSLQPMFFFLSYMLFFQIAAFGNTIYEFGIQGTVHRDIFL